jgi:DNA-binding transcriptional MerR regulator
MAEAPRKSEQAFRTIGELASDLGVPQHILRYWETRFPQLRPLQRAGNRRYYRPADVQLVRRIHRLLSDEGYTVKGVQKLLKNGDASPVPAPPAAERLVAPETTPADVSPAPASVAPAVDLGQLIRIRDRLQDALAE